MKSCLFSMVLVIGASSASPDAKPQSAATVVAKATSAADKLIESLDENQRKKLLFDFDDDKQRLRWSNLPEGIFERRGIRWGDLSDAQKQAVMELFKATLSSNGVQQIVDNMEGDEVLKGGGPPRGRVVFGRDEYFLSILGKPSTSTPWMWQFGGHHLAINATFVGEDVTLSPSLTGGQPVDFVVGGRKVRQLAEEEDLAFELIGSLTPEQINAVVLDDRYTNMIYGPGREGAMPKQEGISAAKLTNEQQETLLQLIGARIGLLKDVHAKKRMKRIEQDLANTWFSWYGPNRPGGASTFRIQGPTILMEYSPQALGGDPTQHTHAMYRDPTNDYGAGSLKTRRAE